MSCLCPSIPKYRVSRLTSDSARNRQLQIQLSWIPIRTRRICHLCPNHRLAVKSHRKRMTPRILLALEALSAASICNLPTLTRVNNLTWSPKVSMSRIIRVSRLQKTLSAMSPRRPFIRQLELQNRKHALSVSVRQTAMINNNRLWEMSHSQKEMNLKPINQNQSNRQRNQKNKRKNLRHKAKINRTQ